MSIATEIVRLRTAKSELFAAITSKGAVLDADQSISEYADAVNTIEVKTGPDIDLTGITVTPDTLLEGFAAIDGSGVRVTGNIKRVSLQQDGNTVSIAKGYTEGGSITVEGGSDSGDTTPATVTVDGNVVTITAGVIEAQTVEIPESEVTETENQITVGIGYLGEELTVTKGSSSSVEYGYINNSQNFQLYDMSVNPPAAAGSPRSLVLKTFVMPEDPPVQTVDYLRIIGGIDGNDARSVTQTEDVTGTVTFTGANPNTFDMKYFDDNDGEWKDIQIDTPISLTAAPARASMLPEGKGAKILDIKGTLGNDTDHQCRIVFTGFECGYIDWSDSARTGNYIFELLGPVSALHQGAEQLPSYALRGFLQDTSVYGWTLFPYNGDGTKDSYYQHYSDANPFANVTLSTECFAYMFAGSEVVVPVELPAETLPEKCYFHMYDGARIAEMDMGALTLGSYSCAYMFNNCQYLSKLKVHFTEWSDDNHATENWVSGVKSSGTFYKPKALPEIFDESHIPVGWTVVNYEDMETE